jgi:ABC-type uncharacterized transport system permease subunit
MLVALATFPFVIVAGMIWARLWSGFVDFENPGPWFFLFAIPFLIAWIAFNIWVTKRAEKWWLSRQDHAGSAGKVTRR